MHRIVVMFALVALMLVALRAEVRAEYDNEFAPGCPRNETWSPCGRTCEQTCADPERGYCLVKCLPGDKKGACRCERDYHRKEDTGNCVRVEDC
ncbi:chymotrypsin inhibitor Ani s 6-like [Xylocopa sonorina]|uniref:chymotrypsin inhibitor Ani s 6-like n=1 Tax=Xylocopa sonorina TaxID=1818115 RepID=UPI00403A9C33